MRDSMAKHPLYLVELDDGTDHRLEVLMADQLRAELEAPKHSIPVNVSLAPVHTTALWCWSALLRTGVLEPRTTFQEARGRMVLVKRLDDEEDQADVGADPTPQGPGTAQP